MGDMTKSERLAVSNRTTGWISAAESLLLFLFALAPRLITLQKFVTADEAKWVYRSAQFWLALLHGDWAGTMVKLKPAVPTMWTGGLGMAIFNRLHQNLPLSEFLAAIPEFRVDPAVLAAARLPTVLLAAASVAFSAHLLKPMVGRRAALAAGVMLAMAPLFVAHSRVLHHDALMTLFAFPALLLAIRAARTGRWHSLAASGVLAGLAFATKSPIFFLAVFVAGLMVVAAWQQKNGFPLKKFVVWGGLSYLTFVLVWPAAWVSPVGAPLAVILDALAVAAPDSTPDAFLNLGIFYYPVYFAFFAAPLTLAGLAVWLWQRKRLPATARFSTDALVWFAVTFIIFMTFSDKRSPRYILPAFLALTAVAATGWMAWLSQFPRWRKWAVGVLAVAQMLTILPFAPYYFPYTNPLLGGPLTAPHVVKIGWGEGMDAVGAWLNSQPHPRALTVAVSGYASTLTPFFVGNVVSADAAHSDFVVSYIKQRQGEPPLLTDYYRVAVGAAHSVWLDGINYAEIYPGSPVQMMDGGKLFGWRAETPFAPIGQPWGLDVLWRSEPSPVTVAIGDREISVSDGAVISLKHGTATRHTLAIPADMPPGDFPLVLNGQSAGTVSVRHGQLPPDFSPVAAQFGDEIALVGAHVRFDDAARQLVVQLAWQPIPKAWADYTVFVHAIDADGNRLAGFDAQPPVPTSRWLRGEIALTVNPVALPAGVSPNAVRVRVGLYRADTGAPLGEPVILPDGIISK